MVGADGGGGRLRGGFTGIENRKLVLIEAVEKATVADRRGPGCLCIER